MIDNEYRENGILLGFLGTDNILHIRTDHCSIDGTPNEELNGFIKKMNKGQPKYYFYDEDFYAEYKKLGIGAGENSYRD